MNRWHGLLIAVTVALVALIACNSGQKQPGGVGGSSGSSGSSGGGTTATDVQEMSQVFPGILEQFDKNQTGTALDEPFFRRRDARDPALPDQWGLFQVGLTPDLLTRTVGALPAPAEERLALTEHLQYHIRTGGPRDLDRLGAALEQENLLSAGSQAVLRGQIRDAQLGWRRPMLPSRDAAPDKPLIVAVIDSGVDFSHPQLWGQLWRNPGETADNGVDDDGNGLVDDVFGYNFVDDNADVRDEFGHGTFVAGIIAARWNGTGMAGVNPKVKLMILKVIDARGNVKGLPVCRAIFYAVKNGAKIINLSLGLTPPGKPEQRVIEWALKQGVLIVAASGTSGKDTATLSPACLPGVLTVGASDARDRRASFSGWGRHVGLVAPGVDILSLRGQGTDFEGQLNAVDPQHRERYYRADGSSFAAPLAAGVAALVWARDPKLTAEQVKHMLLMSCDDVDQPGWDVSTGAGRLNAARALQADPNHFLHTQITNVEKARFDGKTVLTVRGQAFGTHFKARKLLIAFGKEPDRNDWKEVLTEKDAIADGVLGQIPATAFDRPGTWSVRTVVEDEKGTLRQATIVLAIE
jgi:hypothetical protein